jgi:D-lyxose ketol-isomerase
MSGGNLVIELYRSCKTETLSEEPVFVNVNSIKRTVEPGGTVVLTPGESICL